MTATSGLSPPQIQITDAALDKIISAVCERVMLDQSKREELRGEIEHAAVQYSDRATFRDRGRARTLKRRLTVFRKAAEKLDAQLADETFYHLIESTFIVHRLARSADTRCAIKQLIKAADLFFKPPPDAISRPFPEGFFELPPKEMAGGRAIAGTLRAHF